MAAAPLPVLRLAAPGGPDAPPGMPELAACVILWLLREAELPLLTFEVAVVDVMPPTLLPLLL